MFVFSAGTQSELGGHGASWYVSTLLIWSWLTTSDTMQGDRLEIQMVLGLGMLECFSSNRQSASFDQSARI
jgi:hypothetical protein